MLERDENSNPKQEYSKWSHHLSNIHSNLNNAGPETISMIEFEDRIRVFRNKDGLFNIKQWTFADVEKLLRVIGFDAHIPEFSKNKIDGKSLMKLNDTDLHEMGITKMGELILFRDLMQKLVIINKSEKRSHVCCAKKKKPRALHPIDSKSNDDESSSKNVSTKSVYKEELINRAAEKLRRVSIEIDKHQSKQFKSSDSHCSKHVYVSRVKSCHDLGRTAESESSFEEP